MVREVFDGDGIAPGGLVVWSWFGGVWGFAVRDSMVMAGFGVCICLRGVISNLNSKWVIYRLASGVIVVWCFVCRVVEVFCAVPSEGVFWFRCCKVG